MMQLYVQVKDIIAEQFHSFELSFHDTLQEHQRILTNATVSKVSNMTL